MRWFVGSITDAITTAKQRNVLFVVYVRGDDDASTQMDTTWEDQEISQLCEDSGMVAVKFNADSDEFKQFSQYYPVKCVPCVSFISGSTGEPIEGTDGYINSSEFKQRIQKVLERTKQASSTTPSTRAPASTSSPATVASDSSTSPQTSTVSQASPTLQASATAASQDQKKELSKLEKAARLRQKMEEIHQRKEAEKEEELKKKEIDRRKVGQAVQKSMQERSDQEARRVAQELRKEKEEERLAKERVREQIARDRAEKQSRYESNKREREKSQVAAQEAAQAANQAPKRKINMMSVDTRAKSKSRRSRNVPHNVKMRKFQCKQCPTWYLHRTSLWRHCKDVHQEKKVLHCAQCSYVTGQAATLLCHVEKEHPSAKARGDVEVANTTMTIEGPTVLTEGTDPGPQRGDDEMSLAPSPMSQLPTSPTATGPCICPSGVNCSEMSPLIKFEAEAPEGPTVLTEGTDLGPPRGDDQLSLDPSPMSLLSTSPTATGSYIRPSRGNSSGMLPLIKVEAQASPGPSTTSSMPPPEEEGGTPHPQPQVSQPKATSPSRKRMRTATVREYTSTQTWLDGNIIATEEHNRVYFKQVCVDENGHPMGTQ
ncbi:UBX domain-containing protein 4-like isoform X2 [Patiria miniata]|uniref:C2H2-type domain-containing protein n=1 Tax=Patiria miniata TaxID=46514 RepID=A0A913Z3P3_PATMI|nr:UBX domain-containing protein 4-like isoform X2 [Patiria miniata]